MYQTGLTIKDALTSVSNNLYVLPAIQREFVWGDEQICRLFDSLMQGYPFGTFLFWKVEPERSGEFKFFGFVRNYHERDAPHCPELGTLPNRELTAVLDGQQRLTALNIGLCGSVARKEAYKRRSNPNAYPAKILHLDLLAEHGEDDEGEAYSFRFLERSRAEKEDAALWYPVSDIMSVPNTARLSQWLFAELNKRELGHDDELFNRASDTLHRLYEVVHAPSISYFLEKSQELDRVLRIFIRMNSGGTVLSYSDLLLSIAVAQWSNLDARKEIHGLVDELNRIGSGFAFSKDFVLKAGLMLGDIKSVGFKVENFNRENMGVLENIWGDVRRALMLTVELAASFGLNEHVLRADSALLPIAYYLYRRKPPENWLLHPNHAGDREAIRLWLLRSLLKSSGIWGSGLDTLLNELRTVLRDSHEMFPVEELERAMAARGKSLKFGDAEIEDLVGLEYGNRKVFPLLSVLYPFIDVKQLHHVDHIYPKGLLTRGRLERAGLDSEAAAKCIEARNSLPNLQLLEGLLNVTKSDTPPHEWLDVSFTSEVSRQAYIERHDLGAVPVNAADFMPFLDMRREKMREKLVTLLGDAASPTLSASY